VTVRLDLGMAAPELTAVLCDVPSVSGDEAVLADAVAAALSDCDHLRIARAGNTVVARTGSDRSERVIVAGHLDTVPVARNLPTRRDGQVLWGRGTVDMKGGVAVALRLAAHVPQPVRDVTYIFYDNEEVEADRSGLARVSQHHPEWLAADFAVLMEPTSAQVEGGCNGTLRMAVTVRGRAAHSARWWMGSNAVHAAGEVLDRLRHYVPAEVEVDGLVYREGLSAVDIRGGIAGNVVPDTCVVTVNYRFAPSRSEDDAEAHLHELFDGYELTTLDSAPGARPGLNHPAAAAFVAAVGAEPRPKYGWTDVARFSALGIPAVNYGPGDPSLAHADDERVDLREVQRCEDRMRAWLTAAPAGDGD
jgi:succinyl-diaminopimelate desuccinylase